jgi:hypothetical protein
MKKAIILFTMLLVGISVGYTQATSVSQAQTIFIYNFSRLIQWPAKNATGEFVIGVIGDVDVYKSLVDFVANKKVGSQSILVKQFNDPQSVSPCNIVFIGDGKVARFNEIIGKLEGSNSLIITEKRGMINSGSAIDFFIDQDKLKFVINSSNAEKYNLTVSKSLEGMAYKN